MNKKIIPALIAMATILTACETNTDNPAAQVPATITADTRAVDLDDDYNITLNIGGNEYAYTLIQGGGGSATPGIFIAPGTRTLPVYAYGTIFSSAVAMPMFYGNPTAGVTWSDDANPTITLALAPATARVKATGVDPATEITLHNVDIPWRVGGNFQWSDTDMPPALEPDPNETPATLTGGGYEQIMPGTIGPGELLLTFGGTDQKIITRRAYTFLAGKEYTLEITINTEGEPELADITINDFTAGEEITAGNIGAETNRFLRWANNVRNGVLPMTSGFTLTEDIDISHVGNWEPIGAYTAGKRYMGTFDGGGHTITGLNIDDTGDDRGLFGYTDGATIANLTIREPAVNVTGGEYTGALVGSAVATVISNCHVVGGTITGRNYTGGLAGYAGFSDIVNCSASAAVEGADKVGGLTGMTDSSANIVACHTTGSVTATEIAGGIAGWNTAGCNIYFCHSAADVDCGTGTSAGGIVGFIAGGTITSCRATGNITGNATTTGSLVGNNFGGTASYSNATGTATGGKLIGNGTGIGINDSTDTTVIYATLTTTPGAGTIEARWWKPGTDAVATYIFSSAVWKENLTLDLGRDNAATLKP